MDANASFVPVRFDTATERSSCDQNEQANPNDRIPSPAVSQAADRLREGHVRQLETPSTDSEKVDKGNFLPERVHRKQNDGRESLARNRSFRFTKQDFVRRRMGKFEDSYELCEILGEGAFGAVHMCKNKLNGAERAVKIIDTSRMVEHEYEQVLNEYQILKEIDHPNVIRMYEFYDIDDKFYIVQDIATGGELFDVLQKVGKLPEMDTALLLKQVLSCLKFLASHNIVHRDINLENILLEGNERYEDMKLIDFGLATKFQAGEKLTEIVGKTNYLAPEVLEQRYGPKYDVWACGIVAYACLCGFNPFETDSEAFTRELIMEGHVSFDDPEWHAISDEAKDFVAKLLTYDEHERPSAGEALQHPWIASAIKASWENFKKEDSDRALQSLSNLRSFKPSSKLKQATQAFIASQLLEKQDREHVDKVFRAMDTDCDGKLSIDDLQASYTTFGDSELSEEQMIDLFENCNMSGSGFIEYSDFLICTMKDSEMLDPVKLRAAFDNFDTEHTGYISAENLKKSLACSAINDEVIDKIIKQVDNNNSGMIVFEEFEDIMLHNALPTADDSKTFSA